MYNNLSPAQQFPSPVLMDSIPWPTTLYFAGTTLRLRKTSPRTNGNKGTIDYPLRQLPSHDNNLVGQLHHMIVTPRRTIPWDCCPTGTGQQPHSSNTPEDNKPTWQPSQEDKYPTGQRQLPHRTTTAHDNYPTEQQPNRTNTPREWRDNYPKGQLPLRTTTPHDNYPTG